MMDISTMYIQHESFSTSMKTCKKTVVFLTICVSVNIILFAYFDFKFMKRYSKLNRLQRTIPPNEGDSNLNATNYEGMFRYKDMESNVMAYQPSPPMVSFYEYIIKAENALHDWRLREAPNSGIPWTFDERFKNPCWYEKNVFQCLPYFFIIGVRKCGTTALYNYLIKHPEMISHFKKEPQFFAGDGNIYKTDDIYAYVRMFSGATKEIEQHSYNDKSTTNVNRYIFGDGSTTYLNLNEYWKSKPGNVGLKEPKYVILDYIHKYLPTAKMIMTVRDPVARLYSDYYFTFKRDDDVRDKANPQHFHEFVVKAIQDYRQCLSVHSQRFCVYNRDLFNRDEPFFRYGLSLTYGMYHLFMEELLRLYPREQIYLVKSTEINSRDSMQRLFGFLEMSRLSDVEMGHIITNELSYNKRPEFFKSKGPMLKTTQTLLYEFYRPFNEKMAALTGDDDYLFKIADLE